MLFFVYSLSLPPKFCTFELKLLQSTPESWTVSLGARSAQNSTWVQFGFRVCISLQHHNFHKITSMLCKRIGKCERETKEKNRNGKKRATAKVRTMFVLFLWTERNGEINFNSSCGLLHTETHLHTSKREEERKKSGRNCLIWITAWPQNIRTK